MPSFAASLSDPEIAGVANYVRTNFGNTATANATPQDVRIAPRRRRRSGHGRCGLR